MKNKQKRLKINKKKKKKSIEENKKQLCNKQPGNNELLLSKEREIFKNIYKKRLNKIDQLSKIIDYGDLKFIISNSGTKTNFSKLKDPVAFPDSIRKLKCQLKK